MEYRGVDRGVDRGATRLGGESSMAKVLVTGANGFIGSHLVRALLQRGHEVHCLVRPTSDLTSLRGLPVTLHLGDVREPETLAAPLRDVEYVYHLAARLMATSQQEFEANNAQGTINLLRCTEQAAAPRLKRFLYVSSQAAAGPGRNATPKDETAPLEPISWYGASKQRAEEAVRSYAGRLPFTIVRPPSVYGERERDISQTFPLVERGLQPVLGGPQTALNMVYVEDLVQGMIDAAESEETEGQTYFLVHPQLLHPRDVVQTVARALGKPRGVMFPVPLFALRLFAPVAELLAELTRERARITRDLVREMSQTIAFYQEQQRQLREMPLEDPPRLWLKYVAVASGLGALIEVISRLGRFYTFTPRWAVFGVIFGGFGLSLGSVAYLLRTQGDFQQFTAGTIGAGAAETLNDLGLLPGVSWEFAPGWPLGIRNGMLRSFLLGTAGGGFVLVVNAAMRA